MVKLFKSALNIPIATTRRMSSLFELQTFFINAVSIVSDRPITTVSDRLNELAPITPLSFGAAHVA